jgi:hypothetical protein
MHKLTYPSYKSPNRLTQDNCGVNKGRNKTSTLNCLALVLLAVFMVSVTLEANSTSNFPPLAGAKVTPSEAKERSPAAFYAPDILPKSLVECLGGDATKLFQFCPKPVYFSYCHETETATEVELCLNLQHPIRLFCTACEYSTGSAKTRKLECPKCPDYPSMNETCPTNDAYKYKIEASYK